ncbi:esterase/lipase family protein [Halalkalicoccus tibetensis]|uniref:Esterase/lipase family protein n=1 Tax=Halalkalicoccus tibetensis TaxID=175632 RepID=A0ABD5V210_9EURY
MVRERGPRTVRRRDLLAAFGGAGIALAAGCLDDTTDTDDEDDSDGDDPDPGLPGSDSSCSRDRTDDAALPFDTDGYGGWGGHAHHGTDAGLDERPIVFVHGNGRDACDFDEHAAYLVERGYSGDALWSITFERETSTHEEMSEQLDSFVEAVRGEAGTEQVDLVGHSLGVTGIRYWLADRDRYEHVGSLVGLAGANHGTWTCGPGCAAGPGSTRICDFLSHSCADTPGEALYELNEPDETPGSVDYYTVRGTDDGFFRTRPTSPALGGAENVALEGVDHDGVRTDETTKELLSEWLADGS